MWCLPRVSVRSPHSGVVLPRMSLCFHHESGMIVKLWIAGEGRDKRAMVWTRRWAYWMFSFVVCTVLGLSGAITYYIAMARVNRPITWGRALVTTLPDWYVIAA